MSEWTPKGNYAMVSRDRSIAKCAVQGAEGKTSWLYVLWIGSKRIGHFSDFTEARKASDERLNGSETPRHALSPV